MNGIDRHKKQNGIVSRTLRPTRIEESKKNGFGANLGRLKTIGHIVFEQRESRINRYPIIKINARVRLAGLRQVVGNQRGFEDKYNH